MTENNVYLLLGSNEGNRVGWLNECIALLRQYAGKVAAQSAVYETAAWGVEDQPDFLNMAVQLETALLPMELLEVINNIEKQLGRQREVKWGQRTLDIDILLYGSQMVNHPRLTIPHPYMQQRRFALVPLAEIAPSFVHPVLKKTVGELLADCPDMLEVQKVYNSLPSII